MSLSPMTVYVLREHVSQTVLEFAIKFKASQEQHQESEYVAFIFNTVEDAGGFYRALNGYRIPCRWQS
jgi:hypothetical protein